jgi:hypothetical protein
MESNWPFDLSFVVFLASAVNYVGEEVAQRIDARSLRPGGTLRDRLPGDAKDVRVRKVSGVDAGEESPLIPASDGVVTHLLPERTGVFEVSWSGSAAQGDLDAGDGRPKRVFASNLLDTQESTNASAKTIDMANQTVTASASSSKSDRRLWPWLIAAGLFMLLVEWYVYNRKVHV